MKTISLFTLLFSVAIATAQTLTFSFQNAENVTEGNDTFFQADVFIETDVSFMIQNANIIIKYNTDAFGEDANSLGNFEMIVPDTSVLSGGFYAGFLVQDNEAFRVATSFQQAFSFGSIERFQGTSANIAAGSPIFLFSIKFKYIDTSQSPNVAFANPDNPAFLNQVNTACGPTTQPTGFIPEVPDCINEPGVELQNPETFDSTGTENVLAPDEDTLSTEDFLSLKDELVIFNDANTLTVKTASIDSLATYSIFDLSGRNVASGLGVEEISIAALPSGLYIIVLDFSGESVAKKFVK